METFKPPTPKSTVSQIVPFSVAVAAIPFWLCVLLPTTILFKTLSRIYDKAFLPSKPPKTFVEVKAVSPEERNVERIYDVVLYGATGFTGKIAAEYIAKTYGNTIKWALAGRRRDALEGIVSELRVLTKNSSLDVPLIICDAFRPETLVPMVKQATVVITTVGPFDRYGTPLVELCAQYGTHYCDITGETAWVREMIDKYDGLARETGAKIVHFCGHDCLPWDLLTMTVSDKMKESGEELDTISFFDEFIGAPSGGTLETINNSLNMKPSDKYVSRVKFDPLVLNENGEKSEFSLVDKNPKTMFYSKEMKNWCGFWLMTPVMITCVKRSNALLGYSNKLSFSEAQVYHHGFMNGFTSLVLLFVFLTGILNPPFRWFMQKFFLPKPGEGPSENQLKKGFLRITAIGTSKNKIKKKAVIFFPKDAAYTETARMLVESGLTLALNGDKLSGKGGVHTPATALGYTVLDRLIVGGTTLDTD